MRIVWLVILLAIPAFGQDPRSEVTGEVLRPTATADTESTRAPLVLTLEDALTRAKANDPQIRAALTEMGVAHQATVQSRPQLLPNVNYNIHFVSTHRDDSATRP